MTAYIGYDNFLAYPPDGGYTFPAETAGHELANALNGDLFSTWITGTASNEKISKLFAIPRTADYIAIYGHNIEGLTVEIRGSGGALVHSFSAIAGTNFERFDSITSDTWTLNILGSSGTEYITTISIGEAVQLNPLRTPFAPPPKAQNVEIINNMSVENIPLGRITRTKPFALRIDQTIVSETWIEANSEALIENINTNPFFFTWDDTKEDACICWTDDPVSPPVYRNYGYQDFTIKAWGLR